MKIMPIINGKSSAIHKNTFQGTTKYMTSNYPYGVKLTDTATDFGKGWRDDFTGELRSVSPKFATVRNAFDRRKERTGKVYVGDPDEKIDFNKVLKEHDYAISDMRPAYPNIDKVSAGYFYDDNTRFEEHFQAIADFFDREENAAKRFENEYNQRLQRGINPQGSKEKLDYYIWQQSEAVKQRREALDALNIYNEAKPQKAIKEELGRKIGNLYSYKRSKEDNIRYIESDIKKLIELRTYQERLIESIKSRMDLYEQLKNLPNETENRLDLKWEADDRPNRWLRLSIFDSEKRTITTGLDELKEFVAKYTENNKGIAENIKNKQNELKEAKAYLASTIKDIEITEKEFEAAKAKLIPLFDKLKAFYVRHGIK